MAQTRFAHGAGVGGEGKEGSQHGAQVFSLGNLGDVVPFTEMGKKWGWSGLPGSEQTNSVANSQGGADPRWIES